MKAFDSNTMRADLLPRALTALLAVLAVAGCATQGGEARAAAVTPAAAVAPIEVVVEDVARAEARERERERERLREREQRERERVADEGEALPKAWSAPMIPGLSFADALRRARGARAAFERLAAPAASADEATVKTWFGQAQTFVDQASRMYAASFHAPDATREGRIEAIAEAAELDMTLARSLDEAGLGSLPVAWRADPAIASSFEDIAVGPTRRWRDEARVLARQCIDTARVSGVVTDAARRCETLRTGTPAKAKRAPSQNGGCACSPGDPLCSASLGGWCGSPP